MMSPETRKQLMWAEHDRLWTPPSVVIHESHEGSRRDKKEAEERREKEKEKYCGFEYV